MAATPPPSAHLGGDVPGWRWDEKREFRVGYAYAVSMKVRVFMWIATHRRHLTNVERVRRHFASSDECNLCYNGPEDIDHVLRFCVKTHEQWGCLLGQEVRCSMVLDGDYVERESVLDRGSRLIIECESTFSATVLCSINASRFEQQ
ncbi:hypothetical protein V6N11_013716 [Hibiscus sabdariffa]|uniref:Reverse transcriptase zinc-binding domain-containing protein n=1 Tax=Hibiscus sabdariffa TaxID=183260 RepID=A0ABR1ZJ48_9ROSI